MEQEIRRRSSRVGSETSRRSSDHSFISNYPSCKRDTYVKQYVPSSQVVPGNLISRRKEIPLTNEIIYEPRFKRAFDDDLPKDYARFAQMSPNDEYPNYCITGYTPARRQVMDDEQFQKWLQCSFEKKLHQNVEYFAKRPMRFWMEYHYDPAVNDREYLLKQPPLDFKTVARWRSLMKDLGHGEEENETIDWPTDLIEEMDEKEKYGERDARPRDNSLAAKAIILRTASMGKPCCASIEDLFGKQKELLIIREYFVNKGKDKNKNADEGGYAT